MKESGVTPETLAKLVADPVRILLEKGFLSEIDTEAIVEIRDAHRWITAPVSMTSPSYDGIRSNRTGGSGFYDRERPRYVTRYLAWVTRMKQARLPTQPIIDLARDSIPCDPRLVQRAVGLYPLRVKRA